MKKGTKKVTSLELIKGALGVLTVRMIGIQNDLDAISRILRSGYQPPRTVEDSPRKIITACVSKEKKSPGNDITVTEFCRKYKGRPHRTTIQGWFRTDSEAVDYCKAYTVNGIWYANERALDVYTKPWPLNKNPKKKR